MNNEIIQISCDLIASVGNAKGLFIEAIQMAKQKDIKKAQDLLHEGEVAFQEGHQIHQKLLTKFANGEQIDTNILLVHAECQMMSAEDFQIIAEEVIDFIVNC